MPKYEVAVIRWEPQRGSAIIDAPNQVEARRVAIQGAQKPYGFHAFGHFDSDPELLSKVKITRINRVAE